MKWSEAFIPTLKEDPQDAEVVSHKLLIRAGYVRKLFSGAYSYLPLGVRVIQKITSIIREELNSKGAQEVLLPAIHPPDLWKRTGRYDLLGEVLIKFKDRHGKEIVLGPTHEEIITDLVASNVSSYKNLPLTLYQIQTKFRDEPRPRFGIMRTSEFTMKDAYSFDVDIEGMEKSYAKMYDAYCRIFERCNLPYIPVEADPGMMGGNVSHEFMVPAEAGEDMIVICTKCKYAASTQVAKCVPGKVGGAKKPDPLHIKEVDTPGVTTIEKVSTMLGVRPDNMVKMLIYKCDDSVVGLLLRGDNVANETKLKNFLKCDILELAGEASVRSVTGAPVGFAGPVNLKTKIRLVADFSVKDMVNFVTGANKADKHLMNVNLNRDFKVEEFGDFRVIADGDACPVCNSGIDLKRSIEIGHTFKLGTKYSATLGAKYLDKEGKDKPMVMGCYGIGVNRIASTLIETSNDKFGIIWPVSIAPYRIILISLNSDNEKVKSVSDKLYGDLIKGGYDVLFDDRNESAGIKFKDADLIGIPIKVIVGERKVATGVVEIKDRKTAKSEDVPIGSVLAKLDDMFIKG